MCYGIQRASSFAVLAFLVGSALPAGCSATGPPAPDESAARYHAAMQAVLERDEALGEVRNHASETAPVADAIRGYTASLERLDFSGTPEAFERAFRAHREAWEGTLPFFERYSDLRGELHDVFDAIQARDSTMERVVRPIWSTWGDVEAAVRQYAPPDE